MTSIIDGRIVDAIAGIIAAGASHQRACLIGGQAMRDLHDSCVASGAVIPVVRTSADVDILMSLGTDPKADAALQAALLKEWERDPQRSATYRWKKDHEITLDLATTYGDGDRPGRIVKIGEGAGGSRVKAYRMIPAWLHDLNLTEVCYAPALHKIGLERLRRTALLISKILAVDACLRMFAAGEPQEHWARLPKDLADVLFLTDRSLPSTSLWCRASHQVRPIIRERLEGVRERIEWAKVGKSPHLCRGDDHERLQVVADGLGVWWP